jgi:hypothetical protein
MSAPSCWLNMFGGFSPWKVSWPKLYAPNFWPSMLSMIALQVLHIQAMRADSLGSAYLKHGDACRALQSASSEGTRILPFLQPATFPSTSATISFEGDPESRAAAGLQRITSRTMIVRFKGVANAAIRRIFCNAGFKMATSKRWDVLWGSPLKLDEFRSLNEFQRHNHFPGTWQLGRKDQLYRCGTFHFADYSRIQACHVMPLCQKSSSAYFGLLEKCGL